MDLTKNSTRIGLVVVAIIGIFGITKLVGSDTEDVVPETTTEVTEHVVIEATDIEPETTPATGADVETETETE